MGMTLPEFTPAQESLFLTLGSRALDSRLARPFLGDTMADEIITTIGYGLDKFPTLTRRAWTKGPRSSTSRYGPRDLTRWSASSCSANRMP